MKVGYARTSTSDQIAGIEAQIRDLIAAGCEPRNVYKEHASAVGHRPVLEQALEYVREGETLVITKIDRLARSVIHLNEIINHLNAKGVNLSILNLGLDTNTPTGKMMLNVMGAVAEFEREIMLERQREGIAKAKMDGKYKGRPPLPDEIKEGILSLVSTGATKPYIAKKMKVGVATIYRVINESKAS